MASKEDLNAKLEVIKNISDKETISPVMPVDVYLQEAENLYHWAEQDATELQKGGITKEFIEDLSVRTGACREAQSVWKTTQNAQEEAQTRWKNESPLAYELRDELVHTFRYAFRKQDELLKKVQAISENSGHVDMIQDLNDLAILGTANQAALQAINLDLGKLELAAHTSDEMAKLLAIVNGEKSTRNESITIRNKAFTHLKEAVDEIRACGKYIFWRNEERLKGYKSAYIGKMNKKQNNKEEKE
ncbi:MAG: hypothetical protein IPO21_12620 [Bacteroidales bacterium]|nr:hypothetical protein [Bacteroidales bacterium]